MNVEREFLKDIADHRMTVLRDDGLYRHIRFQEPGTYTAIEFSEAGQKADAIRANIKLLREHLRYYPATPEGWRRERRAKATIENLKAQLAELQEIAE